MAESKVTELLKTFSFSPRSGKTRFKLRTANNFIFAIAVFLPLAFAFTLFWPEQSSLVWLADAISIALLFYFYRIFLNARPIWIRCPHCKRKIATNTPWVCGACEAKNEHVDAFPVVNRCESCGVEPKAYQCHHEDCGKLVFLTDDESLRNYAYCLNPSYDSKEGKIDPTAYAKEKRWREYKISLAKLDIEIKGLDRQLGEDEKKPPSHAEKVEASWAKRKAQTITAAEIYRREKKANAENFKDDSEMRKKADEALDEWYESGGWERLL
jgi:hypothetical protein